MHTTLQSKIERPAGVFKRLKTALVGHFRHYREARRRRFEQDEEFYRKLHQQCVANNIDITWDEDYRLYR